MVSIPYGGHTERWSLSRRGVTWGGGSSSHTGVSYLGDLHGKLGYYTVKGYETLLGRFLVLYEKSPPSVKNINIGDCVHGDKGLTPKVL